MCEMKCNARDERKEGPRSSASDDTEGRIGPLSKRKNLSSCLIQVVLVESCPPVFASGYIVLDCSVEYDNIRLSSYIPYLHKVDSIILGQVVICCKVARSCLSIERTLGSF